ncbi:MAG TPA: DUF4133 domain-containing protein [Opitutaceae bacterium]|nr:DUF4133 domain-containing protein [Opitutaceae bacterium]
MSTVVLNEHDANQGAQSKGEFLGMTGNSAWYLLGSAGATVLMVIVLWGVFEVPLLLCMLVGLCLCLLSVLYVFTLKNNKPEHYDTDFFEAALVEAGVSGLAFGPRAGSRRPPNPFSTNLEMAERAPEPQLRENRATRSTNRGGGSTRQILTNGAVASDPQKEPKGTARQKKDEPEPMVPLRSYEKLQNELEMTQEQLADVLAEHEEV